MAAEAVDSLYVSRCKFGNPALFGAFGNTASGQSVYAEGTMLLINEFFCRWLIVAVGYADNGVGVWQLFLKSAKVSKL